MRPAPNHAAYRDWLAEAINGDEPFGVSDLVLSGFVRVATHPRIYSPAEPVDSALDFAADVRSAPNAIRVLPGPRHWEIFDRLCRDTAVRGSLVADAYFAALAIESGSEWITTDRDYSRFPGLRWRHPLED